MKFTPTEGKPKKRIFVLADFREVIQQVAEECPLVGGQAVAWWAQLYGAMAEPLTSCDIDFWGQRDDLQSLAKALHKKPVYPHKYEMTVWVGGIPLLLKGEKTLVEFIHAVPGLDVFNPERACVSQVFSDGDIRKKMLILSPVSLVIAKLHALRSFDQSGRQDEEHVRISLVTSKHFIAQSLQEKKTRLVLWNIERIIAASQLKAYKRLENKHDFRILSAVPVSEMEEAAASEATPEEDRQRLRQFLSEHWPRVNGT